MTSATAPQTQPAHAGEIGTMSHKQILQSLSGLLIGMFVAMLSSTVVTNALPTIINQLHGTESGYTWVVVATLLALTATTPIWGKLSDLMSPKLLVQLSLVVYVGGSAIAGLSQSVGMLICARAVQGIGAGGLLALVQVIMARMISPRERGRYSGYLGAVFALATVLGPLVGGVIVDTPWLGWRWCFYVGVPFAVAAIIVLQKTLRLPTIKREAKIDYLGASLIVAGVSVLLIWVSLAGTNFDWLSWPSAVMVIGGLALLAVAVWVESKVAEPIIPLAIFKNRTVTYASIASLLVGSSLYGITVFLSQYFQVSRGDSPTMSGVATIPMVLGMFVTSLVIGRIITRTGKWKRYLAAGGVLLVAGLAVLSTMSSTSPYWVLAVGMALAGSGMGATMQNLVLAVQNSVSIRDIGSASATVSFIRSLGGAIGVSALGAVLAGKVTSHVASGLAQLGVPASALGASSGTPDTSALPGPIATVVKSAYGTGTAWAFGLSAVAAAIGAVVIFLIKETPLRASNTAPEELNVILDAEVVQEEALLDLGDAGDPTSGDTLVASARS
ncbi:drug resistance transporter, EmrB/QacA subfamily [Nakamurella panacisegetis]|uniref:Drug resistance transporter, EmrB/QacA subfamily n=1 Tax=Nakamurella panacisegetis TaxID=1090615 RepID=A0A1H0HZU9_9ACTN|nr:MDR family MFS transporter [Nakamurella panacisegetis]SDO24685.1 drug resistance transporter, EmrB/QacA subfamily [Nakamurella panacisegetis]